MKKTNFILLSLGLLFASTSFAGEAYQTYSGTVQITNPQVFKKYLGSTGVCGNNGLAFSGNNYVCGTYSKFNAAMTLTISETYSSEYGMSAFGSFGLVDLYSDPMNTWSSYGMGGVSVQQFQTKFFKSSSEDKSYELHGSVQTYTNQFFIRIIERTQQSIQAELFFNNARMGYASLFNYYGSNEEDPCVVENGNDWVTAIVNDTKVCVNTKYIKSLN